MPNLNISAKSSPTNVRNEDKALQDTSISSSANLGSSQETKTKRFSALDFSSISSSSFQQEGMTTEVEFCRTSNNIQISQTSPNETTGNKPILSFVGIASPNTTANTEKDNPEDINALLIASSTVKPNVRKEPSGAEKKRTKLRREFLANLSIATPEDPETAKSKDEMFAVAYYDKLRETLELEDYHSLMEILNSFETGDAIDLYWKVKPILKPKYTELAEEFLLFLSEREAAAVGQLIPWLRVNTRSKFLRKLEIYFQNQPYRLRKIYTTLNDLNQTEGMTKDKVKSTILPMLKGNAILTDLFLENFIDERPPPSLLEGPYENVDIYKEMARPDTEGLYETIVVPNTDDKFGGANCECHCHKIEDNEYKSRYKHCISCGLRFVHGLVYVQTGRGLQPAIVTFSNNQKVNHNVRLCGKPLHPTASQRKRSPTKQTSSSSKENLDEDTEDEEPGKRKAKSTPKPPRKRAKTEKINKTTKPVSPKKSNDTNREIKSRKRSNSTKRSKKEDKKTDKRKDTQFNKSKHKELGQEPNQLKGKEKINGKIGTQQIVTDIVNNTENDNGVEPVDRSEVNDAEPSTSNKCDLSGSGESGELTNADNDAEQFVDHTNSIDTVDCIEKPLTPGQQTAESESEFCEESSQDNYESDSSNSSSMSNNQSQSDSNTNDEPWRREEDTVILETFQREDDKYYALQVVCDRLPNRTMSQIRNRFSTLMTLLIQSLKSNK